MKVHSLETLKQGGMGREEWKVSGQVREGVVGPESTDGDPVSPRLPESPSVYPSVHPSVRPSRLSES